MANCMGSECYETTVHLRNLGPRHKSIGIDGGRRCPESEEIGDLTDKFVYLIIGFHFTGSYKILDVLTGF